MTEPRLQWKMPSFLPTLIVVGVVFVVGIQLRSYQLDLVRVEHFDEGVYASNLYVGPPDFCFPYQHLYAPPLFPAVLEWMLILSGGNAGSVIAVNVIMGVLLIFAIGWTSSGLFRNAPDQSKLNPPSQFLSSKYRVSIAAASAMVITCMSELMIQYSRTALTDISLTLWLTLAVGASVRGLRQSNWKWIIAASLFTTLAWWTKYNGWLPLAIVGAGVAGWFVFEVRRLKVASPTLIQFGVLSALAVVMWLPCLAGLQATGGYAAVAANHAGYVVGPAGWLNSIQNHFAVDRFYTTWISAIGIGAAIIVANSWLLLTTQGQVLRSNYYVQCVGISIAVLMAVATRFVGLLPVLFLLNVIAAVIQWMNHKSEADRPTNSLGRWILLAWILGLIVATPMYRPYPRLILPLLAGLIIGAGYGIELLFRRLFGTYAPESLASPQVEEAIKWKDRTSRSMGVVLIICSVMMSRSYSASALAPRSEFVEIANQIRESILKDYRETSREARDGIATGVAVLGEPGLFFQLALPAKMFPQIVAQPVATTAAITSAAASEIPMYLVTGPHAKEAVAELEAMPETVRLVATFEYRPSALVLLDDMSPSQIRDRAPERIQVWTRQR
ncbi:ArnT family glycosyltransferase [Planctomicrobium sp. SH527]|uniref:ArnT family glycosyltransferase n=1 Tax=Planctomicrobium sp. SH527 TaxID=3448123 RepID=UPI003F5C6A6C